MKPFDAAGGSGRGRLAGLAASLLLAAAVTGARAAETGLSRPNPDGAPTRVEVAIHLADLDEISGAGQNFLADVVIRAYWTDLRLAGRWPNLHGVPLDEVWNPRLQLLNAQGINPMLPERIEVAPSGRVCCRQRWLGRYSAYFVVVTR